ncbi:MAG TPA: DAK2 domain-containing protein, partial [Coriobacteriia bacterium]|nr:DAK2 domain-containing protein [Coriobacteriia bacterium]
RRQTAERTESLRTGGVSRVPAKPIGFVAVAAGDGVKEILASLGVDRVVNGGQTMNPSTAELLEAVGRVHADSVIILPNNPNIHMAANQVLPLATVPVAVVPTTSVPESFAAMLAADSSGELSQIVEAMTAAAASVRTGEVTTAIKDSTSPIGPIRKGQVIGITADEIAVVGDDVEDVSLRLAGLIAGDGETLTLLGGEGFSESELRRLAEMISEAHPDLEVEHHAGGQPLYPVIMSVE